MQYYENLNGIMGAYELRGKMRSENEKEVGYTHSFPLFRDLNPGEVGAFKASVYPLCNNGFSLLSALPTIHPVVRKELIRLITESLREQGEL